jgi:hypothetical protein
MVFYLYEYVVTFFNDTSICERRLDNISPLVDFKEAIIVCIW